VQLTIMGFVLVPVFESNNVYLVMGIAGEFRRGRRRRDTPPATTDRLTRALGRCVTAGLLLLLATFETTYHKGKRRYAGMFWIIMVAMFVTTLGTTLIGASSGAANSPRSGRPRL